MNYLNLCQRTASEAGISHSSPPNVLGQTDQKKQVVEWVDAAYQEIQLIHQGWKFLWDEFSVETVANQKEVALPTNCKRPDINDFLVYRTSNPDDSRDLRYCKFPAFRRRFRFDKVANAGHPTVVTFDPKGMLRFTPIPDDAYTVEFGGWIKPHVLSGNADLPVIPEENRMIIVWRAVMLAAEELEATMRYTTAERNYQEQLEKLRHIHAPEFTYRVRPFA